LYEYIQTRNDKDAIAVFVDQVIFSQNLQNLTNTTKHCGKVVYKPNNPQFATQGAVSASNYILKKDVVTLETYDYNNYPTDPYQSLNCNNCGNQSVSNLYKTKGPSCIENGLCNGVTNIKSYGNRTSRYAYLDPRLFNRKYMPNFNNTHKHRSGGEIGTTTALE
jgi:hypothetical protein